MIKKSPYRHLPPTPPSPTTVNKIKKEIGDFAGASPDQYELFPEPKVLVIP